MSNSNDITKSKAWDWGMVMKNKGAAYNGDGGVYRELSWRRPTMDSYGVLARWKSEGLKKILDLGTGLGRHAILFAKEGFDVSGVDLGEEGVEAAKKWAKEEGLKIDFKVGDMLDLPYSDGEFNAVFAYFVISHTNLEGFKKTLSEIRRVLADNGEFYVTVGSKKAWGWQKDWPLVDANTKKRMEDGPEFEVPHFYADYEEIMRLFNGAALEVVGLEEKMIWRQAKMDDRGEEVGKKLGDEFGGISGGWHWHVLGRKK